MRVFIEVRKKLKKLNCKKKKIKILKKLTGLVLVL